MLYAMYVAPEARRAGVGSALLEGIVDRARQLDGLEQIHLWVLRSPGRPCPAAALYEAHGFQAQGPCVVDDIRWGQVSLDAEYRVRRLQRDASR
jgi:GNAT superfamily N-acetyltransferase